MLTPKFIREHFNIVEESFKKRNSNVSLEDFKSLEQSRLSLIVNIEKMKSIRNAFSKEIGIKKSKKEDVTDIMEEMQQLSPKIKEEEKNLNEINEQVHKFCLSIPNILDSSVPKGVDANDNQIISKWGTPKQFGFEIKDHVDLGVSKSIMDFEKAAKVTGSRFVFLKGKGAKLERALINFFLTEHEKRGYEEFLAPSIVNDTSLLGTGQLPKFSEDLFHLSKPDNYYLIPTAEVPLTNYFREEILKEENLPIKMVGFTPCFRSEAGAAGKDTRGMIRQHQFNKVEMVKITHPDHSKEEHEKMLEDGEHLLRLLNIPYRVSLLCGGDIGFGPQKCYDLEVWLPSKNEYVEISSISNFGEFQANRANIRFKNQAGKNQVVHTLNGSGLAVGRCLVAILENFQDEFGDIAIPEVLHPYTGFTSI